MTKRWLLPTFILLATVTVMALVATVVIPTRGPFHWDEATHAFKGLVIAHDLRQGDLLSFAYNSYRQVLYPPLFSWFLALGFLTFGPTAVTVSWVSLLFFGLGAGLMWLAGGQLDSQRLRLRRTNFTGAIAAFLWLTSPPLLAYATQGMLEIPGLVMTSLTLLVALKLLHDDQPVGSSPPREWMLLGLLVALTYLMRPQYGVVVGLALALSLLFHMRGHLWRSQTFYALLPFVLILGAWFAYTPKLPSTLHWLINVPDGVDEPYSVAGWLFYPLAVVRNSGSPWLFGLYMVALVWAWFKRRSPGVNLLVILVLVLFTISMFHHNKQARYLFPMLPAFFLLGGYGIAEFWRWAWRRAGAWRMVGVVSLLLLLLQVGLLLQTAIQPGPGSSSDSGSDSTTAYIFEAIKEASNTLVIGSMEMTTPGPPLLDWRLSADAGLLAPPQAGSAAQIDEGRHLGEIAARLPLPAWLTQAVIQVVTSYDQPAPVHTLYVDLPLRASYSQGAESYTAFVTDLLADQAIEQVLIIYRTNTSRYGSEYLAAPLTGKGWSLVKTEGFAGPGMSVEVWRP
ncbi:MAG: glycosyltransferase family 39 protein [Caldilineaceae bacterium]|nr:glycosyltransferase family 39 protein [Caldilineaceae bacterium]